MLILSLTLENVAVYRGKQQILFSTAKTSPITLIGGKNGAGKTSILNAIPLVLYGGRFRRILNGSSYPEYLNGLVHHGERTAAIMLEFDQAEQAQQVRYVVKRTWNRTSRGRATDRLHVWTNGIPRPDLVAMWPKFVEGIMPMAVADLAIFDGEKIESLADPASSAEVLRTSLFGLLGLNLVDRLRGDLQDYRRRMAKAHDKQRSIDLANRLTEAETRLAEALREVESASQALSDAESAAADLEFQLHTANDQFARAGGELLAERDEFHRHLAVANASADATERELFHLASSDLPLTLVPDLLKLVVAAGEQHEASRFARQARSTMATRDHQLAGRLIAELGLDDAEARLVRDVFRSDLESVERPSLPKFSPSLECTDATRELLHRRYSDLQVAAKRLTEQLVVHNSEAERLEGILAAVPDANTIAPTVRLVANAEAEFRAAERSVATAGFALDDARRRAAHLQREVDARAREALDAGTADSNVIRIAREIIAADAALKEFADRMVRKHLGRITKATNIALETLLHKQGLVGGVSIDADDLSVALLDPSGQPVNALRLSAGERQVLATAVLWGLSQCTGKVLPTVIDTPVGRLDSTHRANLVERYFPNASRQVVLLSTDEEIVGEHLKCLLPYVGARYWLDFDETEARTFIERGYFGE